MSNMLLSSIIWCEQVDYGLNLQEMNVSDQFVFSWFPSRRKKVHFKQQYCSGKEYNLQKTTITSTWHTQNITIHKRWQSMTFLYEYWLFNGNNFGGLSDQIKKKKRGCKRFPKLVFKHGRPGVKALTRNQEVKSRKITEGTRKKEMFSQL